MDANALRWRVRAKDPRRRSQLLKPRSSGNPADAGVFSASRNRPNLYCGHSVRLPNRCWTIWLLPWSLHKLGEGEDRETVVCA